MAILSLLPFSLFPRGQLPANADALACAWSVALVQHQLWHDPVHLLQSNVFFPDPRAGAYQDPMVAPALLAWPLAALGLGVAATYNLLLVVTLVASALAAFLLVRELVPGFVPALLAGLVFAFTTANYDSVARVQILQLQWTPLALLFLVRLVRQGRSLDGLGLGVAVALQALSSAYYALYLSALLILTLPWLWRTLPAPRLRHAPWRPMALAVGVALLLVLPLASAQRSHLSYAPTKRMLRNGAQPSTSYLQALPSNWIYGRALGREAVSYDDRYFPGVLPLVLFAAGLPLLVRSRRERVFPGLPDDTSAWLYYLLAFGGAAFAFGLGRDLLFFGYVFPGPYRWLHALPGFDATRVPSRFVPFARLALAVLAGLGAQALLSRCRRASVRAVLAGVLLVALPLEHVSVPLQAWSVPEGKTLPAVYRFLAEQPRGGTLEFPPHPLTRRREEVIWPWLSTAHWQPLVNGYSSFQPAWLPLVFDELLDRFPSRSTLDLLRTMGVRYVVFHPLPTGYEESDTAGERFEQESPRFPNELVLLASFDDRDVYSAPLRRLGGERVYRLEGQPAPPPARSPGARLKPEGWSCASVPIDAGCERAFDARLDTAFATGRKQRVGDLLRVRLKAATRVGAVRLVYGPWAPYYPRRPELAVGLGGDWRRVAREQRFERVALLRALLARDPRAALEFTLDGQPIDALEIRLGPAPGSPDAWLIPELELDAP